MDIKSVKVDAARGEHGDWVGEIPGMGDLRLQVRSFSSSAYRSFMAREIAKVSREQREGGRADAPLLPIVRDNLITRGMVEHILIGWDNLTAGGEPMSYSKEEAMNLLSDPDYRVFRNAVEWAAEQVEMVRADEVQAVVGNS